MTTTDPAPLTAPAAPDLSGLPAGFTWGVATAAYQMEGARPSSATAPSIW